MITPMDFYLDVEPLPLEQSLILSIGYGYIKSHALPTLGRNLKVTCQFHEKDGSALFSEWLHVATNVASDGPTCMLLANKWSILEFARLIASVSQYSNSDVLW